MDIATWSSVTSLAVCLRQLPTCLRFQGFRTWMPSPEFCVKSRQVLHHVCENRSKSPFLLQCKLFWAQWKIGLRCGGDIEYLPCSHVSWPVCRWTPSTGQTSTAVCCLCIAFACYCLFAFLLLFLARSATSSARPSSGKARWGRVEACNKRRLGLCFFSWPAMPHEWHNMVSGWTFQIPNKNGAENDEQIIRTKPIYVKLYDMHALG